MDDRWAWTSISESAGTNNDIGQMNRDDTWSSFRKILHHNTQGKIADLIVVDGVSHYCFYNDNLSTNYCWPMLL